MERLRGDGPARLGLCDDHEAREGKRSACICQEISEYVGKYAEIPTMCELSAGPRE
jgi:hypothetical protein